jgi:hypothetical protein
MRANARMLCGARYFGNRRQQRLLEEGNTQKRLMLLATMLYRELEVLRLDQRSRKSCMMK